MGTAVDTAPELHLALRHTIYIACIICYHCVPPEEVTSYDSGDAASTDQVPGNTIHSKPHRATVLDINSLPMYLLTATCMAQQPPVHGTIALQPASYMKTPLQSTLLRVDPPSAVILTMCQGHGPRASIRCATCKQHLQCEVSDEIMVYI